MFFCLFPVIRAKVVGSEQIEVGNNIYGYPITQIKYDIKQLKVHGVKCLISCLCLVTHPILISRLLLSPISDVQRPGRGYRSHLHCLLLCSVWSESEDQWRRLSDHRYNAPAFLIHPLSILLILLRVMGSGGCWSQSQLTLGERRGSPWTVRRSIAGPTYRAKQPLSLIHTYGQLRVSNLTPLCM